MQKVVVVDDVLTNALLLKGFVKRLENVEVSAFTDPAKALAWCEQNVPDLVLLDHVMPEMNGCEFLRRLRLNPALDDVPVVMVTAQEGTETLYEALQAGANDFLRKPIDGAELVARSRNMLSLRARQREAEHANDRWHLAGGEAGLWECDLVQGERYFSPRYSELLGYGSEELGRMLPEPLQALVHPDEAALLAAQLERNRQQPQAAVDVVVRLRTKNGGHRWFSVRARSSCDGAGNAVRIAGLLTDVHELRLAEAQLSVSQKAAAMGRLTSGLAHEFNNLLISVSGFSSMALRRINDADIVRECLNEVATAASSAAELTRQMLALGRQQASEPQIVEVDAFVQRLAGTLAPQAEGGVAFELRLGAPGAMVNIDPRQFEEVLSNLAVNAREAMPGGGRLSVATTLSDAGGGLLAIRVQDTGCGMDDETRSRMFEPFFTTKQPGEGPGLGLPVALGIVEQAGGRIEAESAPGAGSTFVVYLPVATAPVAAGEAAKAA